MTIWLSELSIFPSTYQIEKQKSINSEWRSIFEYFFLSAEEITKVYHWREIAMKFLLSAGI